MPVTPKLNTSIGSINLPNTPPKLDVTPAPQQGGPVSLDIMASLSKLTDSVNQFAADIAELKKRVAAVETQSAATAKDMVAVKLVMTGIDPALNDLKSKLNTFYTEYSNHIHETGFNFETFDFLSKTPGNNKPNFYMPYVWLNSQPSLSQGEKEQSVQKYLNIMTKPKPSPSK